MPPTNMYDVPMRVINIVHILFVGVYLLRDFYYTGLVAFSILYVCYRGFVYNGREERRHVMLRTFKTAWYVNLLFIGIFIYCVGRGIYYSQWESAQTSAESLALGGFLLFWIHRSWSRVYSFETE